MQIQYIRENICILKNNEIYRISDMLKKNFHHKIIADELLKKQEYKNTILYNYFSILKKRNIITYDEDIFMNCILKFQTNEKIIPYNEDTILIHLRAGDAFETMGIGNDYVSNKILYLLKKYKKNYTNIKNIVIVTALHYGHSCLKSKYYKGNTYSYNDKNKEKNIQYIHKFLLNISLLYPELSIQIKSNHNIDYDLVYLVTCKHLIVSNGGFSHLVKELNNKLSLRSI